MRENTLLLVICLLYCVGISLSAPGRSADEVLIGEVDIAMRGDDDNPKQIASTSERSFTSNKCIVDNKAYSHSQMIPSRDESSHCLCVAGEVYCWWQTFGGPKLSDKLPTDEEDEEEDEEEEDEDDDEDSWTTEEDDYSAARPEATPEASGHSLNHNGNEDGNQAGNVKENNENRLAANLTTTAALSTTTARPTCLVMGRTYQQGEVLPHSTGNCVECSCGSEGRIECSPRDCVGLRPQNAGGGDLDLFELDRDRGIEGSF
ncbi:uncharacterized protein LOC131663691 [Phymastichus coffea]|uniref:uncharacterized protein LOC131663691 n=1 Tax=Phymastichus coffea TaxID=108790 RepID=UPI00273BDCEA|nr:uncharacterized protein LOC131663691 [Phymastichus coffea]